MDLDTNKEEGVEGEAALGIEWHLKLCAKCLSQQNYKNPVLTPGQGSPSMAPCSPTYQNEPLLAEVTPKATHPPNKEAHCNQKGAWNWLVLVTVVEEVN